MNPMFQAWLDEGEAKGMAKGMAKSFLNLARSKYRRVPSSRAAQVRAASVPQIEIWQRRILTATSLDEVFSGDADDGSAVNGATAKPPRPKRTAK